MEEFFSALLEFGVGEAEVEFMVGRSGRRAFLQGSPVRMRERGGRRQEKMLFPLVKRWWPWRIRLPRVPRSKRWRRDWTGLRGAGGRC